MSAYYRGQMMGEAIALEKRIDQFIAEHFCKTKRLQNEMYLMFLGDNRISFDGKKQIFEWIAKKHHKEWAKSFSYDIYCDNTKGKSALSAALSFVIEQRNIMAHRMIRAGHDDLLEEDKITFLIVKNEVKPVEYTQEKVSYYAMLVLAISVHIGKKLTEYSKSPSNPISVHSKRAVKGG